MGIGVRTAINDLIIRAAMSPAVNLAWRWRILRQLGWRKIEESYIRDGCLFIGFDLEIGNHSYLNRQVFIDASARVSIGKHVQVGQRATVLTSTHEIGGSAVRGGAPKTLPVSIGDGCWVGAAALILPGVSVAEGCVIAAGAVVTADTHPNGLYAGVPATRVRDLK